MSVEIIDKRGNGQPWIMSLIGAALISLTAVAVNDHTRILASEIRIENNEKVVNILVDNQKSAISDLKESIKTLNLKLDMLLEVNGKNDYSKFNRK